MDRIFTLWPHLEVLDLTYNKLNDYEEVTSLITGMMVKRNLIKVIGITGNSFYNK